MGKCRAGLIKDKACPSDVGEGLFIGRRSADERPFNLLRPFYAPLRRIEIFVDLR
jgi:hypothetical protein